MRRSIDGREVGLVTQAVESPHLGGKTLGLAKIDKDLREPGTAVVATVEGEPVPGESRPPPRVRPGAQAREGIVGTYIRAGRGGPYTGGRACGAPACE